MKHSAVVTATHYVCWASLIKLLIPVVVAVIGACWAMVESHTSRPHADAVHVREFDRVLGELKAIRGDVAELRNLVLEVSGRK